ncbi:hypothetical protein KVR01_012315 [Diaporthe batatas]|uniref:uncharacterized protein n=1 Tax=Diaporthe batatas TaxID=748121 RepID=UPI001D0445C3|nr:uncharacterized protein KVR01_012315 [Diaporthe batatas]KAG8157653.1 hypothetical protein KVR01_012315 [Diaporthe batatas]
MCDPSLLLSPHVFLLALAFRHRAFKSPSLNQNPHELGQLRIHPGEKEMELAFRPGILDTYIFRNPIRDAMGYRMGEARLSQGTISKCISTVGMLSGFEHPTMAYGLRYMAGNSMDRDVNISSALRDLVMDHAPNSITFQKHYLQRIICADLWAIHRGLEPQQALLEQATSLGHSLSRRRPINLTRKQTEELKKDPNYQRLDRKWTAAVPRSDRRRKLGLKRKALWTRLQKRKLDEIRDDWGKTQGVEDVERQIAGEDITQALEDPRSVQPMGVVQQRMFDALTSPLVNDLDAQLRRRTEAIKALVAYCGEEDPVVPLLVRGTMSASESNPQQTPKAEMQEYKEATLVAFGNVRRCFLCVAKAEILGRSHPRFRHLCHPFSRSDHLREHFITVHLNYQGEGDSFVCPICKVALIHKKHLQNHTEKVHGIKTMRRNNTETRGT